MTQNTRNRIIKQAIACIAQNSNAGMDDIARSAGIGRATLFRHFKSRADLLTELKLSASEQLMAAVGPVLESRLSARDKLVKVAGLLVPLGASLNVTSYLNKSIKQEQDERVMAGYEAHMAYVRQLCLDLKAEGVLTGDAPLVWLVTGLTSLVYAAWEKVESGDIAPKQAPWLVLETFLAGHGAPETTTWLKKLKDANQ